MTPGDEATAASSPDAVRALGEQLERCGYLDTSLPEALGAPEPLATLAALFGLGSAVPGSALTGVDAAALEAEGLLAREGERVRARAADQRLERAADGARRRRRPRRDPTSCRGRASRRRRSRT